MPLFADEIRSIIGASHYRLLAKQRRETPMPAKSKWVRTALCLLFISLFAFSFSAFAQNTSGSITGVVQDASGAVIPGAQVKLINQEQGITARETITNEAGIYLFSALPAATFTVTAELPGFKTYKKTDVKLFVNDRLGLPRSCSKWVRRGNPSRWKRQPSCLRRCRPSGQVPSPADRWWTSH